MGAPNHVESDCRTPEGVAIGLIDAIIATARVLRRHYADVLDAAAIEDLRSDEDIAWLLEEATTPPKQP
jgi:hypothetical protein